MTAHVDHRPLMLFFHAFSRVGLLKPLYGFAALLAVVAGVLSLSADSRLRLLIDFRVNIHVVFGMLLLGLILARYHWCIRRLPSRLPPNARELSRHLARIVYLMLYVVIGVRQLISIIVCLKHGGGLDFNLMDDHAPLDLNDASLGFKGLNFKDDLQMLVLTSICAVVFVKFLGYRLHLRLHDRATSF